MQISFYPKFNSLIYCLLSTLHTCKRNTLPNADSLQRTNYGPCIATRLRRVGILFLITLLASESAHADALIPYMWVPLGQIVLLPLVVLIEVLVIWKLFVEVSFLQVVWAGLLMNLASTSVGIGLFAVTGPVFINPLTDFWWRSGIKWHSTLDVLFSIVFALILFNISWFVESIVLKRLCPAIEPEYIVKACRFVNALTYIGLLSFASIVG